MRAGPFGPVLALLLLLVLGGCGGSDESGKGAANDAGGAPALTNRVDLLLMIDNSMSMADKQAWLAEALPRLLQRMTNPAAGTPVNDLHVAVISSSLGGHGARQCSEGATSYDPTQNDRAHLIPSVRAGLSSHHDLSFLWWEPSGTHGGQSDSAAFTSDFSAHVSAVGEAGCGYEAALEAWYRFLVDPAPPLNVVVEDQVAKNEGVDAIVLTQRRDFLRPSSALVVLMLSDENDCSIIDGGYNWLAAEIQDEQGLQALLPRATSQCDQDPDHPCCLSCAATDVPASCPAPSADPNCQLGKWDELGDHPNLRCWQQKRRFGVEFLYPVRKYVEALTQPRICTLWGPTGPLGCTDETRVDNPLFASGLRSPSLVFLAGIVGVPWQDLASEASLSDPLALELLSVPELEKRGRFAWLVPECAEKVPLAELPNPISICARRSRSDSPDDPYMVESDTPRSGKSPATGAPIQGTGANVGASPINGHEWNTNRGDLQFACTFPLKQPRDCTDKEGCDCADFEQGYTANNPVCQSPSGTYGKTQYFAKAYPGLRQLAVLQDLGRQGIVASICPKSVTQPTSPSYGFNAAMDSIAAALSPVLVAK